MNDALRGDVELVSSDEFFCHLSLCIIFTLLEAANSFIQLKTQNSAKISPLDLFSFNCQPGQGQASQSHVFELETRAGSEPLMGTRREMPSFDACTNVAPSDLPRRLAISSAGLLEARPLRISLSSALQRLNISGAIIRILK